MSDDQQLPDDPPMVDEVFTDDELAALADIDALLADPAHVGFTERRRRGRRGRGHRQAASHRARRATPAVVTAATAPTASTAGGATAPVVDISTARRSRRRTAWSLVGAAVAGAAAAALITGAVVSRNDNPTTAEPAPATASAGGSPADGAQNTERVSLAGTAAGPWRQRFRPAHRASVRGGDRRSISPACRPRTGGDFYQVWVKNCDGSLLVPAGSFHDLTDAIGWVGVSMTDFPVLTITQEIRGARQGRRTGIVGADRGQRNARQLPVLIVS